MACLRQTLISVNLLWAHDIENIWIFQSELARSWLAVDLPGARIPRDFIVVTAVDARVVHIAHQRLPEVNWSGARQRFRVVVTYRTVVWVTSGHWSVEHRDGRSKARTGLAVDWRELKSDCEDGEEDECRPKEFQNQSGLQSAQKWDKWLAVKTASETSIDSLQVVVCVIELFAGEEVGVVCRNSSSVYNDLSSASLKKMLHSLWRNGGML